MYREHSENAKEIINSIKSIEKGIKKSLKEGNKSDAKRYTNIHGLLIGAWMEVSFYKLIHEPQFTELDRTIILNNSNSLEENWINVLNMGFAKAFRIEIDEKTFKKIKISDKLERTNQLRYEDILNFIKKDMNEVILIRNKIAHGQLYYTFNNVVSEIVPESQELIHSNNYFKSIRRLKTMKLVIEMIIQISTSPKTFQRDFDKIYGEIKNLKLNYTTKLYKRNVETMISKHKRSDKWKSKNMTEHTE